MFQCFSKLVRATRPTAFTVDPFQSGNQFIFFHAHTKRGNALGIAMATLGILDTADNVAFHFQINLFGTNYVAGAERSLPDSVLGLVGELYYVKHTYKYK